MEYELSVVVPTIHPEAWRPMYDSLAKSVGKYSYEVIFIGPHDLPENMVGVPDIKVIKDWGCPMRCIQIGVLNSTGKLMVVGADDALFVEDSLVESIPLYYEKCKRTDALLMKYTEGAGRPTHTDVHASDALWTAGHYPHIRGLGGINPEWKCGSIMMDNEYFKEIGGLDCQYQVMNFGMHDLAYRVQNHGGEIHFANKFMVNLDWTPGNEAYTYMQDAANKSWSLLVSHYGVPTDRYKIPFDNWKQSPEKWSRFTDPPPPIEIPPYLLHLVKKSRKRDRKRRNRRK